MNVTRRKIVLGTAALVWTGLPTRAASIMTAEKAHLLVVAGELLLVDIRTPEEWTETGTGQGAKRLDMRREDFASALDGLLKGDRGKPVALICARGVRSGQLSRVLREAGYNNIIDVPEGMLGSSAGPGWIARGLPLDRGQF